MTLDGGVSVSFHDVGYKVKVRKRKCKSVEETKQIIKDISGIFKPGMNAILGPTGSGKTTFLDVLAGRKDKAGLEGLVLIDGKPQPQNFNCMSGYVVQENLIMGTLTVRECIAFSANLRIPSSSQEDKSGKVEEILRELGLVKCADSMMGNEFIRGVSGGEAKRTSIGMELVVSRSVLFLDEPTTGLDANTATSVMEFLHRLSKRGKTIIFSIHQPRYAIHRKFDNILLLANGRTVYHGPAQSSLDYFAGLGFVCEEHNNPADFFLDVINSASRRILPSSETYYENEGVHVSDDDEDSARVNLSSSSLHEKYLQSRVYDSIKMELGNIYLNYQSQGLVTSVEGFSGHANGFLTQLKYLSKRSVTSLIRNPPAVAMQFSFACLFAVIVGVIYFQIGTNLESGLQNRVGALFFIVMNQLFGNLSSIDLFIKERKIFMHESASGYYRVSSYYFSKLFGDLIPMRILPVTLFSLVSYFMIGFQPEVDKFFIFYLALILTTLSGSSVGFFVSSSVNIFIVANLLTALTFVLMMLFGGFLVNLKTMPSWLNWLQYLSIIRYSLNMLCINELHDLVLYKEDNGTTVEYPNVGKHYLDNQGIKYETLWYVWQNCFALFSFILILMLASYVQLRRTPKYK